MTLYAFLILLYLSIFFFAAGLSGLLFYKSSFIQNLINLEVSMLGVTLSFILFSMYVGDVTGQIHALFVLILAAAESCFGLALVTVVLKTKGNLNFEDTLTTNATYLS